jgi:coenzyme F420-reducing hydrogenase alpha subunit
METMYCDRSHAVETVNVKEEARKLIDKLPDDSTWDDLMHEIYVRQAIEGGLADSEAGRGTSVEQVRKDFGLPQ